MNFKSATAGGPHRGDKVNDEWYPRFAQTFPVKLWWFAKHGYQPHIWQAVFHGAATNGILTRFRHLVAGRRGGKTLSAAWEILFYALHPSEFHRDTHGQDSSRALWIWVLTKDYPTGFPALTTLLEVMDQAGLVKEKDFKYNKTERRIEFVDSGSIIQFRTAEDPQSLRGAGLDILWMDEAAFIGNPDAWLVTRPALSDKLGIVISTTTPHGKNWFWEEFWSPEALKDPNQFRVEYTSLDNPYFPRDEWQYALDHFHPVMFKQEYMAAFDAMTGIALHGDWLHYWVSGNADTKTNDISLKPYRSDTGKLDLRLFLGIDPAVSLSDNADHFAMAVIGLTKDNAQGFLLDYFLGRLAFPDQLDKIAEWQLRYRPELIGIESNAYQRALAQQAARLDGFPGIVPVISKGKKQERIMAMSPLFKVGKIRISKRHSDFIDQWVNFDPEAKNGDDDLLDAVEIALGVAGILLPMKPYASQFEDRPPSSVEEEALAVVRAARGKRDRYDPELGSEA